MRRTQRAKQPHRKGMEVSLGEVKKIKFSMKLIKWKREGTPLLNLCMADKPPAFSQVLGDCCFTVRVLQHLDRNMHSITPQKYLIIPIWDQLRTRGCDKN